LIFFVERIWRGVSSSNIGSFGNRRGNSSFFFFFTFFDIIITAEVAEATAIFGALANDVASIGGRMIDPQGKTKVDGEQTSEVDEVVTSNGSSHTVSNTSVEGTSLISDCHVDDAFAKGEGRNNTEDPSQNLGGFFSAFQE